MDTGARNRRWWTGWTVILTFAKVRVAGSNPVFRSKHVPWSEARNGPLTSPDSVKRKREASQGTRSTSEQSISVSRLGFAGSEEVHVGGVVESSMFDFVEAGPVEKFEDFDAAWCSVDVGVFPGVDAVVAHEAGER